MRTMQTISPATEAGVAVTLPPLPAYGMSMSST